MGATVLNHDEFRDYLLGNLEAERRTAVEEQILVDPSVYEELLAAEEELIDQYLRGGLSKAEQLKFETHFLITAERHKNLRFGKLLKRYMDGHPAFVPDRASEYSVRLCEVSDSGKELLDSYSFEVTSE